jgi:hypothetical protein
LAVAGVDADALPAEICGQFGMSAQDVAEKIVLNHQSIQ